MRIGWLVLAGLAGGGVWVARNWDDVRQAVGIEEPAELRAVQLAKTDYSMSRHATNQAVVAERMAEIDGVEVVGWRAEAQDERLYWVRFLYVESGRLSCFLFQVGVGALSVRFVAPDSELAEQMGVGAAVPR